MNDVETYTAAVLKVSAGPYQEKQLCALRTIAALHEISISEDAGYLTVYVTITSFPRAFNFAELWAIFDGPFEYLG